MADRTQRCSRETAVHSQVESYQCLKMVLDASLLSTLRYNIRIKNKLNNPKNRQAPLSTSWYSSYWKGSLWVALDYGQPTYFNCIKSGGTCELTTILVRRGHGDTSSNSRRGYLHIHKIYRIRWLHLCRRVRPPPPLVSRIWHQTIWWRSFPPGVLANMQHHILIITPRPTRKRSGSTCYVPIYRSNRNIWSLSILEII